MKHGDDKNKITLRIHSCDRGSRSSNGSIYWHNYERLCSEHNNATSTQQQQNQTADPEQIKNYLTQAIQALDSGNNTKAAEQVDLAEDKLEDMTGATVTEDDEDEEIEEGAGEDTDEPGDIDTNDEEDRP